MKCDDCESLAFSSLHSNAPYSSSLASSASASSTSVWSDASSQNSDDTSITAPTFSSDPYERCSSRPALLSQSLDSSRDAIKHSSLLTRQTYVPAPEIPSELRQNPRRTCSSSTSRTGCPPPLVRQADRKVNFVDNLVDSSTHIVEAIWPTSSVICRSGTGGTGVLPLRTFIQETLRRSRTSYSTLQVALYYLILIKPHVPEWDFTMEQVDDCHASRAIQCGRRMFLAALILASKYLQDRNYSARAWSKISGLNTQEINQNEMAFLLAVNWKLHITNTIYIRWTDCVMKFTPPQPPSPGPAAQLVYERQCEEFKSVILNLTPELDNYDEASLWSPTRSHFRGGPLRTLYTPPNERVSAFGHDHEATPVAKSCGAPAIMEPNPTTVHTSGRFAPSIGLLPTPRLTPQGSGYSTPALNAASYLLGKNSSMGFAMSHACSANIIQNLDRWPAPLTSSPQSYVTRRSSLANMISTASSPESMVSDSSRTSRSSSISSSSSLVSAPSSRLDALARYRYAKLPSERTNLMPTIVSVPEDYEENCITSSPESYTGTVSKDLCSLEEGTPLGHREREMNEAARALQDLHNHGRRAVYRTAAPKPTLKRSRTASIDNTLQDNVRDLLNGPHRSCLPAWSDNVVRSRDSFAERSRQIAIQSTVEGARKRLCCSAEAAESQAMSSLHPVMGGLGGPGMWEGILNS